MIKELCLVAVIRENSSRRMIFPVLLYNWLMLMFSINLPISQLQVSSLVVIEVSKHCNCSKHISRLSGTEPLKFNFTRLDEFFYLIKVIYF